jgi:thiazole synthase
MEDKLVIADKSFSSRLFLGTGKFSSGELMERAILASGCEMVTVALKRIDMRGQNDNIMQYLNNKSLQILPNTSGVRTAKEAILVAQMAREALQTNWIKLEIHPDPKYLMPDHIETLKAAEELVKLGFVVLPYVHADPVFCKQLEDVGVAAVMPLGSFIGSNRGLKTEDFIKVIIEQSNVPVIVDAGIGTPSHAAAAMELGADAVLINTAIAVATDPVSMAESFKLSVIAGRKAYKAGMSYSLEHSMATSPLTPFINDL